MSLTPAEVEELADLRERCRMGGVSALTERKMLRLEQREGEGEQADMFGADAGIGKVGDKKQRFYTPDKLSDRILTRLAARLGGAPDVFIDSWLGRGAFARSARKLWPDAYIIGVDIAKNAEGFQPRHNVCDKTIVGDWLEVADDIKAGIADHLYVVASSNPPFSGDTPEKRAETIAHVQAARRVSDSTCLILPWAYLGAIEAYRPIMAGEDAPVESWPFGPRVWPLHLREAAAFWWTKERQGCPAKRSSLDIVNGTVPRKAGTHTEWLEPWK